MVGLINFSGVKTEFAPIPAGIYESKLVDAKFGVTGEQSKTPGSPKVDLRFAITEEGEGENNYKNRQLFRTCTFNADSLWAFKRTMAALGADVDWEGEVDVEDLCRKMIERPCLVKVSVREYQGKEGNQVDDIVPTEATRLAQEDAARGGGDVVEQSTFGNDEPVASGKRGK